MEYPDPAADVPTDLKPCPICGRTFRPDALTRHHRVCEKNAAKKRKVFDSSKQRALEDAPTPPKADPPKKPTAKAKDAADSKPKSNWREKHEELIDTIKKTRGGGKENAAAVSQNGEPIKKKVPSDYVQCEACGRHFNQRAAERHIPWCQKKKSETPQSTSVPVEAKEKLIARVRYRPPQGRSRRPLHRKTKTADSVEENRPPVVMVSSRGKAVVRSSPPSLVDKRNARNASLDRINNNNNNSNVNNNNNTNNANLRRRSGSRSREKDVTSTSSPDLASHIIKFKERFPNSKKKRNGDLEESLTSEQLRELFSCSRITERCPRTVPGVRLSGQQNRNDNWNYSNSDVVRSASSSGGSSNSSWNKRSVVRPTLPEVSSSEMSGWGNGGPKMCWSGELSDSACSTGSSSGGGSLPPLSRESIDEQMLTITTHCHQCHSRFPLVAAKYCCECGARRRGSPILISQTG